jgi:thymidylate synthase
MIYFQEHSFNYNYLRGLKIAINPLLKTEPSRVGPVINLGQAFFEISAEDPRLIFLTSRKINPVFAIVESAWILLGSNRLAPLRNEIADFEKYSDDGETLFGAYGKRLRESFGFDQIELSIEILRKDPASRRVVLNMYSPGDLTAVSKDIPCNTSVFLKIVNGRLDITVINRSNDLFLGIPYNIFVFGLLQQYIAERLNCPIGVQRHFTDCLHLYERDLQRARDVVATNDLNEIDQISSRFGWKYSNDILENIEKINSCSYESIDGELGEFLQRFCSASRREVKKKLVDYDFPKGFFGYLARQWLEQPDPNQRVDQQNDFGSLNFTSDMKKFIALLSCASTEIATSIENLSISLSGRLSEIEILTSGVSSAQILQFFDNDENRALKALLLSALWSSIDPFFAGSSPGQRVIDEIKTAAMSLGLSQDEIRLFSVNVTTLNNMIASVAD